MREKEVPEQTQETALAPSQTRLRQKSRPQQTHNVGWHGQALLDTESRQPRLNFVEPCHPGPLPHGQTRTGGFGASGTHPTELSSAAWPCKPFDHDSIPLNLATLSLFIRSAGGPHVLWTG